jgi:hypothetical protein
MDPQILLLTSFGTLKGSGFFAAFSVLEQGLTGMAFFTLYDLVRSPGKYYPSPMLTASVQDRLTSQIH